MHVIANSSDWLLVQACCFPPHQLKWVLCCVEVPSYFQVRLISYHTVVMFSWSSWFFCGKVGMETFPALSFIGWLCKHRYIFLVETQPMTRGGVFLSLGTPSPWTLKTKSVVWWPGQKHLHWFAVLQIMGKVRRLNWVMAKLEEVSSTHCWRFCQFSQWLCSEADDGLAQAIPLAQM